MTYDKAKEKVIKIFDELNLNEATELSKYVAKNVEERLESEIKKTQDLVEYLKQKQ